VIPPVEAGTAFCCSEQQMILSGIGTNMGSMEETLAFLFRKKGGRPLSRVEMEFMLSMDLRWFTMAQAKEILVLSVAGGYLRETGENQFMPAFDWENVQIPALYRPDYNVLLAAVKQSATEKSAPGMPDEQVATRSDARKEQVAAGPGAPTALKRDPGPSLFERLLTHIVTASGMEKKNVIRRMNCLKEMDVIPEVRLMLVAREAGVDTSDLTVEIHERIRQYARG